MAPDAEVTYVDGSDPVAAAKAAAGADVAIVFATQWTTEAEDAQSLSLPHDQDALIAAVAKANRNSVVVLETGGPVLMPWLDKVPAVIEAWYPGQRGGEAIANIRSEERRVGQEWCSTCRTRWEQYQIKKK